MRVKNASMTARGALEMKQAIGATVVVVIAKVESGSEDHSTRCTNSGAGTSDRTSLDGRVREVDDPKIDEPPEIRQSYEFKPKDLDYSEKKQLGSRSIREEEQLKEVAGVGDYTDFGPARRDRYSAET